MCRAVAATPFGVAITAMTKAMFGIVGQVATFETKTLVSLLPAAIQPDHLPDDFDFVIYLHFSRIWPSGSGSDGDFGALQMQK